MCKAVGFEPEEIERVVRQAAGSGADRRRAATATRRARASARVIPLSDPILIKAPNWGLCRYRVQMRFDERPSGSTRSGPAATLAMQMRNWRYPRGIARTAVLGTGAGHIDTAVERIENLRLRNAHVAQLDRVPGYEPGGREFESLRARHINFKIYHLKR